MRCPRCNRPVMPGLESCLACGASMAAKQPAPQTYPPRRPSGTSDLLVQRQHLLSWNFQMRTRWREILFPGAPGDLFLDLWQAFRRNLPPFWIAASGMAFGYYHFKNKRLPWGLGVLLAELAYLALIGASGIYRFQAPLLTFWAIVIGFAAGSEAVWHSFITRGYEKGIRLALMSASSVLMFFFLLTLSGYFFDTFFLIGRQRVNFQEALHLGEEVIPAGARGLTKSVGNLDQDIMRGDVVMGRAGGQMYYQRGNIFRVIAKPGDVLAVRDCEIYVNGETVPAGHWPLDADWPGNRCEAKIPPVRTFDGQLLTIAQVNRAHVVHWEAVPVQQWSLEKLELIYWPPEQWRRF